MAVAGEHIGHQASKPIVRCRVDAVGCLKVSKRRFELVDTEQSEARMEFETSAMKVGESRWVQPL